VIDFQQIIGWFNSIFKLSSDVQPVIRQIRENTKTKTLDGIQFIDFEEPSLSNIQQLNAILKENGLEEIDEELLKPSLLDIEQVLQRMQQDFTVDELAKAIEEPVIVDPGQEFRPIEIDLADVCVPQQTTETPEFSEKELIDAACEPTPPVPEKVATIQEVSTTFPTEDLQLDDSFLPEPSDDSFNQLLQEAKNSVESDIFPKNGPDCIAKMKDIAKKVQEKVNTYTDVKNKIQEIQLDYYYETIVNSYYQAFLNGYGEVNRLKDELNDVSSSTDQKSKERAAEIQKILSTINKDYAFASDRSDVQEKMEEIIFGFSNQFDIEIESGFLGLFQSSPLIKINKEKTPLSGKVKDIPDELLRYLDTAQKDSTDSAAKITEQAKKTEKDLDDAFLSTVASVEKYSFAFGLNQFLEKEAIEPDFLDIANENKAKQEEISKKYLDLKEKERKAQEDIDNINKEISSELANMNCKSKEVPAKVEAGKDLNFKNVSKNPTIFDYSWWLKFSSLATLVNLVPVHWPIGLLIPTPSGLIRIPFPIIWFPIFVAPTDKLIAVLFIGQCGILPCPYLFLQHFLPVPVGPFQSNNPYFAAAIGGPVNISNHEPLPPATLPSFDLVFGILSALLENFRNGISVDVNALITEVQNQLEQVQNSAQRYLAFSQRDINSIIENAKNQATQTVQSAKQTAEAAIRQAQENGQMMIDNARRRYQDANLLSAVTLSITREVQQKVNDAQNMIEDARRFASEITFDAEARANALKENAEQTVKAIIENGKQAYEQKLQEIQQLEDQYNETVKTLRDLIDKISVPTIDLGLINLPVLLSSYSLALGSLKALAADLSPRAIQFGFPTEISPQFSASLPIFNDELPPWERLSILNIPLLFFLWKWCKSGKYVGGFLPESIFGPI
jgi:F0F1-type ATP synthase membrane subunit b/b'